MTTVAMLCRKAHIIRLGAGAALSGLYLCRSALCAGLPDCSAGQEGGDQSLCSPPGHDRCLRTGLVNWHGCPGRYVRPTSCLHLLLAAACCHCGASVPCPRSSPAFLQGGFVFMTRLALWLVARLIISAVTATHASRHALLSWPCVLVKALQ